MITASQITPNFIANKPSKELVSYSIADLNQDGVITTIEKKVDRRGNIYTERGGRQGVDWQYADVPEGSYSTLIRRVLTQNPSGGGLVWDSGLSGYAETSRVAIVTDVDSGDGTVVVWDELYSYADVQVWVENGMDVTIPPATQWVNAWTDYESGTLVLQEGEDGSFLTDEYREAVEERREEDLEAIRERQAIDDAEAERLAAEAAAAAEAERQAAEAAAEAELMAQVRDWTVIQETSITIPSISSGDEVFDITGLAYSFDVKTNRGIAKVAAQSESYDIVYRIEERGFLREAVGQFKARVNIQYRVTLIDGPGREPRIVSGNTPGYTLADAETFYNEAVRITQESVLREIEGGEWIEEEKVEFSWFEFNENIQSVFDEDRSNIITDVATTRVNYPDTIRFVDQGNKMVIVDFDGVDVTGDGIGVKYSGLVAFTVVKGRRLVVTYENEDPVTWQKMAEDAAPEGVTRTGNLFTFSMYGGDRMEVSIDNEFAGYRPFLVQTKGREWFLTEEPDDTSYLAFTKIEGISYSESIDRYYLYEGRKYSEENIKVSSFNTLGINTPQYILDQLTDPEMLATLREPTVNAPMTEPEISFVSPDDVKEAVGDAGGAVVDAGADAVGTVVDAGSDLVEDIAPNLKWWLIGGAVVIGGFVLLAVFVNAKARS